MQATTTSLPVHIKLEIERRPAAARRLGIVVPPTKKAIIPQVKESDLQFHAMEAKRRPVAAHRQGLLPRNVESNDVPTHDFRDTEAHRLEVDRRPMAAKRQGHVITNNHVDNNPVLARAAVPLKDTQYAILEATRRPAAALRSGISAVDYTSVSSTSAAVTAAVAAAAVAAKPVPFGATAAGAMEARRRLVAASRVGIRQHSETTAAAAAVAVAALDLVDSEYYAMEATRRPRAMARLRKQRGSMSANDLAAAAAAAAAVEREVAAAAEEAAAAAASYLVNNGVTAVSDMNLDKNKKKNDVLLTAAGADSGANEGPNPFASLERMLESRLSENNLSGMVGGAGGRKSRGSSLRGAANYPGSPAGAAAMNLSRLGSSSNLQRCGSSASLTNNNGGVVANNTVTRHVSCAVDETTGDVVCRVDDSGDVVLSCHSDTATGMRCEFPAPTPA